MSDDSARHTAEGRARRLARARARHGSATATSAARERLLAATVELTAREGYAALTLASLTAAARVSRRSFYECFADKEACLLTALQAVQEQLLAELRQELDAEPERAPRLVAERLVAFASSTPAAARFLMGDAMAAGPAALRARDRAVDEVGALIETAYESLDPSVRVPDLSPRILVGGICRVLAARLRRSSRLEPELGAELVRWVRSYEQPLAEHRWRGLVPVQLPPAAPGSGVVHLAPPPPAEQVIGEDAVSRHRAQILAAVARLGDRRGYAATTVGEIAQEAGLSSRAFYRSFADKQEAFAAVHEQQFRAIMAVTAGAFFAQGEWPERIWAASRAFACYLEGNPSLARTSFVASHAGDPLRFGRIEDLVGAFALFLQEGYQYRVLESPPTALALNLIAMTVFELGYRYIGVDRIHELSSLVPHAAFMSLAPFLGAEETNGFLELRIESELHRAPA